MNDTKPNFYEVLKDTRKSKQISLKEISDYTKINIGYLESLENGEFDVLPNVYTRLFLRSYCDYIGLDSKEILDEYQIYTVGTKRDDFSSLNEDLQESTTKKTSNSQTNSSSPLKKVNDSKEMLMQSGTIILIIIIFIIIFNLNG